MNYEIFYWQRAFENFARQPITRKRTRDTSRDSTFLSSLILYLPVPILYLPK